MSHDLKNLPIVQSGLTDDSVVFGAKEGQSDSAPDPISAAALWEYTLSKVESDQQRLQDALGIAELAETAETSAAAAVAAAESAAASAASAVEVTGALPRVNRSTLKALDTDQITVAYLTEPGREGMFRWRTGNFSTQVTRDPLEGVFIAADGVSASVGAWQRVYDGPINALWFGAAGDGATDDTAAIQASIDFAIYEGKRRVYLPAGRYKTSDTLHLGYGEDYHSVVLEGDGRRYRGESLLSGTTIDATGFSDRPAIAIQGARGTVVRRLSVLGALASYIVANQLGTNSATIDDTDPNNWNDPSLSATQDSRYAPYAGVAIDPYSGSTPSPSYPNVSFPDWTGISTQYGKNHSSDVLLDEVFISGFTVGVANKPSNNDENADFTTLNKCYIERCKWGVSIGNYQSRNFGLYDVTFGYCHTCLVNNKHGVRIGKFGGTISNMSATLCIQLMDLDATRAFPITFINLYAESIWRIGDLQSASTNVGSFRFIGAQFKFDLQVDSRGYPATVLGTANGRWIDISFEGCSFERYGSVCVLDHQNVALDGCQTWYVGTRANRYEQFAHNLLCGGLVLKDLSSGSRSRLKSRHYNLDTGALDGDPRSTHLVTYGLRNACIPLYAEAVGNGSGITMHPPMPFRYVSGKASFPNMSLVGRTLTFDAGASEYDANVRGYMPGDVIYDSDSRSVFFIRSRVGNTITAELQNNYRSDGEGGWETITPFSTTSGNFHFMPSRIYTTSHYIQATFTSGSATLTNVGRQDGDAGNFHTDIAVGDYLLINEHADRFIGPGSAKINALDGGAKTITLSGNAGSSFTRQLAYFIRQAPDNA